MRPRIILPDGFEAATAKPKDISRRRSRLRLIAAAISAVIVIFPIWASFYTDWLWFRQLGYGAVFSTTLMTKALSGAAAGLIAAAFIYFNLKFALRLTPGSQPARKFIGVEGERVLAPNPADMAKHLALPAALVVGVFTGMLAWGAWDVFLRYHYQSPLGQSDPVFGRDVAYYFYTLPAMEKLATLSLVTVSAALICAALVYLARATNAFIGEERIRFALPRRARAHMLGLLAALSFVIAWQAYLMIPNLVYSARGPVAGASHTDLTATLPTLYAQAAAALLVALLSVVSIFLAKTRLLWGGLALCAITLNELLFGRPRGRAVERRDDLQIAAARPRPLQPFAHKVAHPFRSRLVIVARLVNDIWISVVIVSFDQSFLVRIEKHLDGARL